MYRSDLCTDQGQYEFYHEAQDTGEIELEFKIRDAAAKAVERPETFSRGTMIPWITPHIYSFVKDWPPNSATRYDSLLVRLHPSLQGSPETATIIAEHILRDALLSAKLEADCN